MNNIYSDRGLQTKGNCPNCFCMGWTNYRCANECVNEETGEGHRYQQFCFGPAKDKVFLDARSIMRLCRNDDIDYKEAVMDFEDVVGVGNRTLSVPTNPPRRPFEFWEDDPHCEMYMFLLKDMFYVDLKNRKLEDWIDEKAWRD